MSIINRVPRGWLGTLDAKTQGRTPKEPLTNLTPTFDMTPNYLADIPLQTETAAATLGSGTIGTLVNTVTVPAAELWYVYGVSGISISGPSGNTKYKFNLALDTNTGIGAQFLIDHDVGFTAPLVQFESYVRGISYTVPLLCGGGVQFGMWQTELWNNTMSSITSVLYRSVTV